MLADHKHDPNRTALVIGNSFDNETLDADEVLQDQKYYTEMFEIDRIRKEEREEYLKCINDVSIVMI
jgi:hypothetical protein